MTLRPDEVVLRLIAVVSVVMAIVISKSRAKLVVYRKDLQITFAILLIIVILADSIAGLVFAIAGLILFIRVMDNKKNLRKVQRDGNIDIITTPFVTAEDMQKAQTNSLVDQKQLNTGIKGFIGTRGEPVYSAQGVDTDKSLLPGYVFDNDDHSFVDIVRQ